MPFKQDREYRMAQPFSAVEGEEYVVEGYATTFDKPYEFGLGGAYEEVRSTALDGADMSDVIFQVNHEGMVLARQRNGTLQLTKDAHGLKVRADLSGSEQGRQLYEAIKNGLMDRMSWGFTVPDDGWSYERATRTSIIEKVGKVFDVSAVSIPANNDTCISARSAGNPAMKAAIEADARKRQAIAARLKLAC